MLTEIKTLTPQQEAQIPIVKQQWIDKMFSTDRIDRPKFEQGIKWACEELLSIKVPEIVYCDSWDEAVYRSAAYAHDVETPTDEDMAGIFNHYSTHVSILFSAHWACYYDFFRQIGVLESDSFNNYVNLITSGVFTIYEFEDRIYVVEPPVKYVRNEANQPHNPDGYAFTFADGTGKYYLTGRFVPSKFFEAIKNRTFTTEEFFALENEEDRSICLHAMAQIHGDNFLGEFFSKNLKEVDTFVDKKAPQYLENTTGGMNIGVYTLLRGEVFGNPAAYVRCFCPSTDRMFFLGCNPEINNAKDAIASLYPIPRKLKEEIMYIHRQGEIFTTVLTENGKTKLKQMEKSDFEDTVTISGDEYFSKMRYEY